MDKNSPIEELHSIGKERSEEAGRLFSELGLHEQSGNEDART